MKRLTVAAVLLATSCAGCASDPSDVVLRDTQVLDPPRISMLLRRAPIGPAEDLRIDPLLDSAELSAHLLQVRTVYARRLHRQHDLTVLIHRGSADVYVDNRRRPAEAGDVFHIPRGTPYELLNRGPEPLVAIMVFTPPLTAADVIAVAPQARSYPREAP